MLEVSGESRKVLVRLENVDKAFGKKYIIQNLNLDVYDGDYSGDWVFLYCGYFGRRKSDDCWRFDSQSISFREKMKRKSRKY